jgi:catechol 2,3-dioxygenase
MYRTRIGHVHLKVRDLKKAIEFYTQFLQMRVTERVGEQFVFLSGGPHHHEVALQSVGSDAPPAPRRSPGLFHVAFEVPDKRSFAVAYRALVDAGVSVYPVDYGISWAMYFKDPDGNGVEIYVDTRQDPQGRELWGGETVVLDRDTILSWLE